MSELSYIDDELDVGFTPGDSYVPVNTASEALLEIDPISLVAGNVTGKAAIPSMQSISFPTRPM